MGLSHADTALMVIAQIGLSMIGASIVSIRTLYKCTDDGKDGFLIAPFVEKKQFPVIMELFMEAIFLLITVPTVE